MNKYEIVTYTRMSALYHRRRQGFLEFADSLIKALSLILSSGAAVSLLNQSSTLALWLSLLVVFATSISLVFGFSRKATIHNTLARRWLELESKVAKAGDDESALSEYGAEMPLIEQDEPPSLGALVRLCQREVMRANGHKESELPQVPIRHKLLAHFWDFQTPPAMDGESPSSQPTPATP